MGRLDPVLGKNSASIQRTARAADPTRFYARTIGAVLVAEKSCCVWGRLEREAPRLSASHSLKQLPRAPETLRGTLEASTLPGIWRRLTRCQFRSGAKVHLTGTVRVSAA